MSAMTHLPDSNKPNTELPSDRDLLRRFIHDGDEASFAAIVERHASLVMSVCRRVVGQSPDVDDAFQATFFALSQQPESIYQCRSLSGWLYSVAWRASVKLVRLRKRTMTQPLPEQTPASEPDPLDVIAQANDLASLDEELHQLPQKYRDVLVMSYFAQQSNQEIADQLNESKGAIDGRIRDARRILRVRLARRGVEVGVLAVATAYVQSSASAASPALIQKAIRLGAPGMTGPDVAALNAADLAKMKSLTSTGVPLMSKIGLSVAAGLLLASGLWGMSQLAAFQNGAGADKAAVADIFDGQKDSGDPVELSGKTSAEYEPAAPGNVDPFAVVSVSQASPTTDLRTAAVPTKPRRSGIAATTEFSRRSERDAERRINEMMQEARTPYLTFPGDNPLSEVLKRIAITLSDRQGTAIMIMTDRRALDNESIASLEDVIVKDIEIPEDTMTVGSVLDHILSQTDPPLTWIAKDELLLITTEVAAESEEYMFLRSYDITRLREISQLTTTVWESGYQGGGGGGFFNLLAEPQQAVMGGMGGGGMPPAKPRTKKSGPSKKQANESDPDLQKQEAILTWEAGLLQTVQDLSSPQCQWFDVDGQGGRLSIAGNRLIVRQNRKGHEQVVAVLEQLEMAADDIVEAAKQ